jgi:hypothetical protein
MCAQTALPLLLSVVSLGTLTGPARADEAASTPPPRVVTDPAFDRLTDLALLGQALNGQDASLLTDAGLQLADAERVLERTHRSGITAHRVLEKATRLAAANGDKATLDRLGRAAERLSDRPLAALVDRARQLPAAARPDAADAALQKLAAASRGWSLNNTPFDLSTYTNVDPFNRQGTVGAIISGNQPQIQDFNMPGAHGLWFRNQTRRGLRVAVFYHQAGSSSQSVGDYNLPVYTGPSWFVTGWTYVPPGRVIQVLQGDLADRYYYYRAEEPGRVWQGNYHRLVNTHGNFGYNESPAENNLLRHRGYVSRGFRRLDTGSYVGYTVNLH